MKFMQEQLVPAGEGIGSARGLALPYEAVLPDPVTDYDLVTAGSKWGKEYALQSRRLSRDGFKLEQKAGRSCSGVKPWILVRSRKTGEGIGAMLGYSGNWIIEILPHGQKTIVRIDSIPSGLKPFSMAGTMPLPGVIVAEFSSEWDNGTIPIARFIRANQVQSRKDNQPLVMWNTWFDDNDNLIEQNVIKGARTAAELGCELVVIDAGWYGGAGNWWELCGNWTVNRERFPNGLEPVIDEVRKREMKFGLWIEIESASLNSPVAREHPDWLLHDGDRLVSERSVLDFGNPDVVAWAQSVIDRLMKKYRLDYLKHDFNTDLIINSTEPQYAAGDPLYYHYKGLAEFWGYVRKTYPELILENCASGSLRHDAMTAHFADTHWVSDEVNNNYNLGAIFGATYLFPPETCLHWTCYPDKSAGGATDPAAQFAVSMMGHFGLSGKIYEWDGQTKEMCARQITLYKEIRPIVRNADVYHLTGQADCENPTTSQAALYVDEENGKAVLFAFQGGAETMELTVTLRGLKNEEQYQVIMPEGYGPARTTTGRELMEKGITITFIHRGAGVIILINKSDVQ